MIRNCACSVPRCGGPRLSRASSGAASLAWRAGTVVRQQVSPAYCCPTFRLGRAGACRLPRAAPYLEGLGLPQLAQGAMT